MSNWNSESGYVFSGTTLANNFGVNSGATFSLNGASSNWATGSANELLNGYAASSFTPLTFTISGVPFAKYSMYVYVGDSTVGNWEQATINGSAYSFSTEGGTPITYTAIPYTGLANYPSGNYIEVDGLTGGSQSVTVQGIGQPYAAICSVEIVSKSRSARISCPSLRLCRSPAGARWI